MTSDPIPDVRQGVRRVAEQTEPYAPEHEHRPLGPYAVLTAGFGAVFLGSVAAVAARRGLPERMSAADVATMGLATQKLSRLIAKDRVTSFLRAPFTEYPEPAGHGEVEERARGTGMRLAMGELMICPYCLSQWVAGGLTVGLLAAPRLTRLVSGMWAAYGVADFLQVAYSAAENRA